MLTGLRFDLCVIGFLIIPSYLFYLISYVEKLAQFAVICNHIYRIGILVTVFLIFHFNLPFLSTNLPYDIPYWMRWEDYQSVFLIDCKMCYWDFNYMSQVQPIQIISGLVFLLILFVGFMPWGNFSKEFSIRREVLFFIVLLLLARGNIGQHHLRYEDSVWHKDTLINELSNNLLWLLDKTKSDRRP